MHQHISSFQTGTVVARGARLVERPCKAEQARVELLHILGHARRVIALRVDADEHRLHFVLMLLLCAA